VVTEQRRTVRPRYSFTNMALSLGIVLGIVVLAVVLLPRPHYDAVKQIDPTQPIRAAQRYAHYHVLAPETLPATWRPTSANVYGPDAQHVVHLHIGYYTPDRAYVTLEESDGASIPFVELETAHGKGTGERTIGGVVWHTAYSANQKQRSLWQVTADGATVIVTGSASYDELTVLAMSLR
jgi:hypothetical protein